MRGLAGLLDAVGAIVCWTWIWAGILYAVTQIVFRRSPRLVLWVYVEVKPFFPAALAVHVLGVALGGEVVSALFELVGGLLAWRTIGRDSDDDRWKRRRRKLTERVSRAGSRLTVVSAGAS